MAPSMRPQLPFDLDDTVRRALAEDLGEAGDLTTRAVVPGEAKMDAEVVARDEGVVAGLPVAERVFGAVDRSIEVAWSAADGDRVVADGALGGVHGPAGAILTAERTALNFLTHLSGIATLTRRYVDACDGTPSRVLCTRKTLPGLRALERYAVACGGGTLHRAGLYDGVLIKDNHVAVAGGVGQAVRRARAGVPHTVRVEVEVESLDQVREALGAGADAILLDNADVETVKRAVDLVGERVPLEVSGGIDIDRVRELAGLGLLLISVGRLTHSAPALDIALDVRTGRAGP
jgi:nicotinate-nucleotide pyrophosphorylase (carboxylating)